MSLGQTEQEIKDQLKVLKGLTVTTGIIHDAQKLQLEMWPLVIFEASGCTVKINTEKQFVEVLLVLKKKPSKKKYETGTEVLTQWVRNILWDNTVVKVNFKEVGDVGRKRTTTNRRTNRQRKSN